MLSSSLIQRHSIKAETLESFFSEERYHDSFVSHHPPYSFSLAGRSNRNDVAMIRVKCTVISGEGWRVEEERDGLEVTELRNSVRQN